MEDFDRIELTDPKAIRALAHPARLIVIEVLYDQGISLTATQAAALAGITPSAMSYHLRALERYGIAKRSEDPADGRERPWVRAATNLAVRPSASLPSKAGVAATSAVLAMSLDVLRERLLTAIERAASSDSSHPLARGTSFSTTTVVVTSDEAKELMKRMEDIFEPLRLERRTNVPAGAGHLTYTLITVPDLDFPGTDITT